MVNVPRGHTLPELLVAVTFLGVAMAGVGASTVLGARWAGEAVLRQQGLRVATAALDSLAAADAPTADSTTVGPWALRWRVTTARIRVEAALTGSAVLVSVEGHRLPSVPVLPLPESGVAGGT